MIAKFADDLILSAPLKADEFDPSSDEIVNIQEWSFENSMSLNQGKTWKMIVQGKTNKSPPLPISEKKGRMNLTCLV